MLAICSELELNEATSNGVIMSPLPFLYCECSRECHFRGGLKCSNRMFQRKLARYSKPCSNVVSKKEKKIQYGGECQLKVARYSKSLRNETKSNVIVISTAL